MLRLVPPPRSVETAFVGVPSPEKALDLLGIATERTGGGVTSFEILTRMGIDAVLKNMVGCREPMASRHEWYLVIELSSQARSGLRDIMEDILSTGLERGLLTDAVIAESLEQTKAFWRVRELVGEAQRVEGGVIGHDISVPVAAGPAFLREAGEAVTKLVPGCRAMPFGHLGDGNIHYTVVQPASGDKAAFLARGKDISELVHGICAQARRLDLGGARHRLFQARLPAESERPRRARPDAHAETHARPERHPQSRQGAVSGSGTTCRRLNNSAG